ncbi:MAG: hypothetical protein NT030_07620, partial [Candidatus Saganbacteria bacterium]|nr:hypothetical protein [Candidatus Saganbacteria bacterium]
AGERDKEVLEVAEAEYNKAVDECTKFNGELQRRETQYKDSLTEKGKVPSEIINIEAKKNRLSGIKTKTDLTLNLAKLGGIEARIQKIKFQVMETKEEEAHTEIEKILTEFKDSKILENITKAVKDGHTSFIHLLRAVFTFSWMLGSKGGLLEEINGEGEGRDPFFLAALPYVILLYGSDPQKLQGEHPLLSKALGKMNDVASLKDALELIEKNKAIINDELLKEIENSVPNLKYVLAELIKAAGAENEDLLNLAIDLYKEVKSADKAQTENNFGKRETELLMGKAKLGQIEAGLVLAEALREDDTRTPTLYEESISTLKEILKNDVHPDIALKAGLDLTWAYSSRGGFLEDTGEESDPDFMRGAAILIALIHGPDELKKDEDIYLEMLKGDKNLLDLIMNKKFTKAEKTDFYIDEELLFNAQTPKGRLHGRLAGLYGALERFKDGMIEARLSDKKYLSVSILASARYYEEAVKKYKEEIKIRKDKTTPKAIKELNKLTYELADVLFWGREDYKESIKFLNILLSQLKKITEEKGEKNVEEKESEKWIKLLMLKAYLRLGQMYAYWDTPLKYRDSEDFLKRIMRLTLKTYDPVKALENVQKSESLGKGVKDIVAQASSVLESIYGNPDWSGYNLELKKNFHELAKYCAKKKKTRINIENTARKTGEWYRWKVSLGHAQFHDPLGRNEQNTTLRISLRPEKLKSFEFNLTGIYLDANDPLGKVKEEHKALGYLGATYYLGGMDKLLLSVSAEAKIDWAKEYYRYFINSHLIGDLKLNYKNRIQGEFKYGYNKSLQDNVYGSLLLTPMPFFGTQWASGFAAGYEFNHYPSLHDKELITKNTHTLLMGYTGMLKDVYGRAFLGIPLRPGSPISFSAGLGVDVLDLILKLQEDFGKLEESKLKFIQSARLDLGYSLYVLQSDRYYFNTFSMMLTLGFGK